MKLNDVSDLKLGSNPTCLTLENDSSVNFYNSSNITITKSFSGNKTLTKNCKGTLYLTNSNSHTGGTLINKGILNITNPNAISSGNVTFNGGSLVLSGCSCNFVSNIKNSTSPIIIDTDISQTWSNPLDDTNIAGFTRISSLTGILTLSAATPFTVKGPMLIHMYATNFLSGLAATLNLRSPFPNITSIKCIGFGSSRAIANIYETCTLSSSSSPLFFQQSGYSTFPDNFGFYALNNDNNFYNPCYIDANTSRFSFNNYGSKATNFYSTIFIDGSGCGDIILSPNSTSQAGRFNFYGLVSTSPSFASNFSLRGVAGSIGVVMPTASIMLTSQTSNGISNYSTGSWIIFPNNSMYTRFILNNSPAVGTTYLSGDNAIYPQSRIEFSAAASVKVDLNGYNQTCVGLIGSISASNPIKIGTLEYNNIVNSNLGKTSTFTLSNLPGVRSFYGIIKDSINLVFNSNNNFNTQTLSSYNLYTGYTAISAGTLIVNNLLLSSTPLKLTSATFTKTTLSAAFSLAPTIGETYKLFTGPTINTYPAVTLTGVTGGRSATYNSTTSTITIT
jgi:autotransporter-associated beta strand protein